MKVAVITGASSGIGKEFVYQIAKENCFDSIWIIARRKDRLDQIRAELGDCIRPIALDLTDDQCISEYSSLLKSEHPDVKLLINCSGFGRFGNYQNIPIRDSVDMIDLNCKSLVHMTELTLPYMSKGASIIQLGSLSAFQPVPYLNTYAASKAFVLSYTRGLNAELKPRGIKTMAVCPGWVKTEFFDHADKTDPTGVTYYNKVYSAHDVVSTALKDMRRGKKDVSIHGLRIKLQVFLVKLLPHRLVMRIWMKQQKHI